MEKPKIVHQTRIAFANGIIVIFEDRIHCPGFSHRVIITNGNREMIARDWLCKGTRPTLKSAKYYLDKHHIEYNT